MLKLTANPFVASIETKLIKDSAGKYTTVGVYMYLKGREDPIIFGKESKIFTKAVFND